MITPHGPEVAIRTQEKFQANLRNPWGRGQPAPRLSAIITSQLEARGGPGGEEVVAVDCRTDRVTVGRWINLRRMEYNQRVGCPVPGQGVAPQNIFDRLRSEWWNSGWKSPKADGPGSSPGQFKTPPGQNRNR